MKLPTPVAAMVVLAQSAAAIPSLNVPACPEKATITYNTSVPSTDPTPFPLTQVDLCYDDQAIRIIFTAYNETSFYYNPNLTTNEAIYNYTVMETFISRSTNDPQTYLEFEVSPNNVTFNAFIFNPSKVRAAGAPFDRLYITTPQFDGLIANTTIEKDLEIWTSDVRIPLGFFNVDDCEAKGTKWRMNFFRTVVYQETYPNQTLGGWSPPDAANFHETPFFGHIKFV